MRITGARSWPRVVTALVVATILALGNDLAVADDGAVDEYRSASVSGVVLGADDAPVVGATVIASSLEPGGGATYAKTDTDGLYRVEGLAAGSHIVSVPSPRSGLLRQYWTGEPGGAWDRELAKPLTLSVGEASEGKNFRLNPGGRITGTVTNPDGSMTSWPYVHAYRKTAVAGEIGWVREDTSLENPFALEDLPPGDYAVLFSRSSSSSSPISAHGFSRNRTSLATADLVRVDAGQTSAIDGKLSAGATLAGIVARPTGTPVKGATVGARPVRAKGESVSDWSLRSSIGGVAATSDATGAFVLRGLPAGDYVISARLSKEAVWWPGAASEADARVITVAHESVRDDLALALPKNLSAGTPSISGALRTGDTLTASPGTWTSGTTFTYRWYADGYAIIGATGAALELRDGQAGRHISVEVTGHLADYRSVRAAEVGAPGGPVVGVFHPKRPTISGKAVEEKELTAVAGTTVPGAVPSYQWYVGGKAVRNATQKTFRPVDGQGGKPVTVKVTWRKPGYETRALTSAATAAILRRFHEPEPFVAGYEQVGRPMSIWRGSGTPGAAYSYQWYANGVAIKGATGKSFVPRRAELGKRLTAKVTVRKKGYETLSQTTPRSSKIGRWRTL